MKTRILTVVLICCLYNSDVFGQIWRNDINGVNPNYPSGFNPFTSGDIVVSNLNVSGIGRGPGIGPNNANNRYNANGWNSGSIDANDYFSFTLTPATGYKISFSDFIYTAQISSGTGSFAFRCSIDGFTANIGTPLATATAASYTIDLSAAIYQDITTPVTFRLYAWGLSTAGTTFSVNDFRFNGSVTAVAAGTSYATDYFRSASATANWNSASTWQSSHDGTNYFASTLIPNEFAAAVYISSGNNITVDAAVSSRFLTVNSGGILTNLNANTLTIYDGNSSGYDFIVDGTYILNGRKPVFNTTATAGINNTVRVATNESSPYESDDFGFDPQVTFANGAVFEWATYSAFVTSPGSGFNLVYFPNSPVGVTPVFRVTTSITSGILGANKNTIFNGKFELTGTGVTASFVNTGTKVFRDGLGGTGILNHRVLSTPTWGDCGTFYIGDFLGGASNTSVIDGTLTINLENTALTNDMEIGANTTTTISGNPTFNVGTSVSGSPLSNLAVLGTLTQNSTNPVLLTYGNLIVNGYVGGTGSFTASSSNTTITVSRTAAGSAGFLRFTSGANTIKDFVMNATGTTGRIALASSLNVAGNIMLTTGILVTDANLLTWNNSGGTISNPNPYNSFIATCDANGNPLTATGLNVTTTSPFAGNVGFRIVNVYGSSFINFPVGPDFNRPNRFAINPGTLAGAPSDITVVVGKGDIMFTPQPRVNRIWYVHATNQLNVSQSGIRLYFRKYNWSTNLFGVAQDEIENGFIPTSVYVGRKDYTTSVPNLNNRSAARDILGLDGTEGYAEYPLSTGSSVPGYYKFSAGNFGTVIILPVTITNVKAAKENNKVNIYWSALNETNVQKYEVERSANGSQFQLLSSVAARNNGNALNEYTAADITPLHGKNFYRIKITDKDGKVSYSQVVSLDITDGNTRISVIPNPVHNKQMNVQFANIEAGRYDVLLYNVSGQLIYKKSIDHSGGSATQNIMLPASISKGAYVVRVQNSLINYKLKVVIE